MQRGDGRWLLHRRPAHKHHGGLWEFPGGKVENAESPVNALVRELAEELGIAVNPDSLRPLGFAQSRDDGRGYDTVILLYTASNWEGEVRAREAGAAIEWVDRESLAQRPMPPLDVELVAQAFGPMRPPPARQ